MGVSRHVAAHRLARPPRSLCRRLLLRLCDSTSRLLSIPIISQWFDEAKEALSLAGIPEYCLGFGVASGSDEGYRWDGGCK